MQRERKRWSARGVSLSDLQRREEETREKEERRSFGQNSSEFLKFKNMTKEVVVVCSDVFYKW
jgi:hypothetical protein